MAKQREPLTEVEIYGQRYALTGSDNPGYVESLASHVDRRMKDIAASSPTVDSLKVAVLAAVNIADEYFRLKMDGSQVEGRIAEEAGRLVRILEAGLEEATAHLEDKN